MSNRTVTVEIAGQRLKLTTDADDEHLHRLASLVNERVAEIQQKARPASTQNLMILVALSLADDVYAAEARRRALEEAARRAVTNAIDRIDRRLAAATPESQQGTEPT